MFDIREIKVIRRKVGITQKELARRAKVSQSLIAKLESGNIDISYSNAKRIFDSLESITHESKLKAKDVMSKRLVSAKSNEKVAEIVKRMKKYEISQLPVIDRCVAGLISETTILNNLDKMNKKVGEVMEEIPPIISKESDIEVISNLLKFYPIVLVIDKGKIEGVITKADIITRIKEV